MKNQTIILVLTALLLTACNFPFLPSDRVTFKVQIIQNGASKGEAKLFDMSTVENWIQVGSSTDKWDTTWTASNFGNHAKDFMLHFEVDDAGDLKYSLVDVVQIQVHYSGGVTGWLSPAQTDDQFSNWQDCEDCDSENGDYAYVVNQQPSEQRFYDFGFSIPGDAIIQGIEVRIKGYAVNEL